MKRPNLVQQVLAEIQQEGVVIIDLMEGGDQLSFSMGG
jgi:hypothetical protein